MQLVQFRYFVALAQGVNANLKPSRPVPAVSCEIRSEKSVSV